MQEQTPFHLILRNEPAATAKLRRELDSLADLYEVADELRFDLKVAATEALTNALKGAEDDHPVDVFLRAVDDTIEVEIVDRGVFSGVGAALDRGVDAESGRGIPLMLALVDDVEFTQTGNGTRVRLRKRIQRGDDDSGYSERGFAFA